MVHKHLHSSKRDILRIFEQELYDDFSQRVVKATHFLIVGSFHNPSSHATKWYRITPQSDHKFQK